jgi:hypothetical protein
MDSKRGGWNSEPAPEKGVGQGTKLSAKNSHETNTAISHLQSRQVVNHRVDFLNQKAAFETQLLHLTVGGIDQTAAATG